MVQHLDTEPCRAPAVLHLCLPQQCVPAAADCGQPRVREVQDPLKVERLTVLLKRELDLARGLAVCDLRKIQILRVNPVLILQCGKGRLAILQGSCILLDPRVFFIQAVSDRLAVCGQLVEQSTRLINQISTMINENLNTSIQKIEQAVRYYEEMDERLRREIVQGKGM